MENFEKVIQALVYNLNKAMETAGSADSQKYLSGAARFYEIAVQDIESADAAYVNQQVDKYDDEQSGMYTKFQDTDSHISETLNESKLDKAIKNYKRLF